MPTFQLTMHPASEGDALTLAWGEADEQRHALVDLGRTSDYRALKSYLERIREFELFTITHIDADHIEGAVPLFKENTLPFRAAHVWFNAHEQLVVANTRLPSDAREIQSAYQAEKVTAGLKESGWPWNSHFESGVVSIDSAEGRRAISFNGGLVVTLLSPSDEKLAALLGPWEKALKEAKLRLEDEGVAEQTSTEGREILGQPNVSALAARPFVADPTKPNGSSIAFLAEYMGKRVLLGADAHVDIMKASLRRLGASTTSPMKVDCLKVSHHGSKANTSLDLLQLIDCTTFAFSTDGTRHEHPDPETIARILNNDPTRPKTLIFNFRQDQTTLWDDQDLQQRYNYRCIFPTDEADGITIVL